jgi:hypothetical protein
MKKFFAAILLTTSTTSFAISNSTILSENLELSSAEVTTSENTIIIKGNYRRNIRECSEKVVKMEKNLLKMNKVVVRRGCEQNVGYRPVIEYVKY